MDDDLVASKCHIDASFDAHNDFKSQSSGVFGSGGIISSPKKQHLITFPPHTLI